MKLHAMLEMARNARKAVKTMHRRARAVRTNGTRRA